jgi:lipopolysaccharide assembly outer membrane protein LptD (OstA)
MSHKLRVRGLSPSEPFSFPPFLSVLFSIYFLLFAAHCLAAEKTTINSESLTYDEKTSTYVAKGNVKIHRDDADIEADEITYNDKTSDTVATGNVRYSDKDASISASKAELNLDKKTGILYDARILLKKDNYHVYGNVIQKRGEDYYFSPDATFTTCASRTSRCSTLRISWRRLRLRGRPAF